MKSKKKKNDREVDPHREKLKAQKELSEKKAPKCALHIRGVRRSLRDQFRVACVERGSTMHEEIVRMMKKFVQNRFKIE